MFAQAPASVDAGFLDDVRFWAAAISAITSFAVCAITLLLGPRLARWMYGPCLEVSFSDGPPCVVETHEHNWKPKDGTGNEVDYKDRFLRIRVRNPSVRPAKGCRGYLARLMTRRDGAYRDDHRYDDFIPLRWSWSRLKGEDDKPTKPPDIVLPGGATDYLDVAATYDGRHGWAGGVELQLGFSPQKYRALVHKDVPILLIILVTADDAAPQEIRLEITWDGTFGGLRGRELNEAGVGLS